MADDELATDDHNGAIELACTDHDARCAWQSMHLTRDVLQADYHSALDAGFAARLSRQIEREEPPHQDSVVSFAAARDTRRRAPSSSTPPQSAPFSLWKPVAGLGLAASLAGAAFLFSQLWKSEASLDQQIAQIADTPVTAVANTTPVANAVTNTNASDVQTVAFQSGEPSMQVGNAGTRWRTDSTLPRNQQIEQRLNTLLTNHLEDASMGRVHGMLSHSRVVSYDSMPAKNEGF